MNETEVILVRYWAAARSAAGLAEEKIAVRGPVTLTEVRSELVRRHAEGRLPAVLEACSVLVGDRPASAVDPDQVRIEPGATVEFLPPFAGG